jgi:hypothetical protein
METGRWVEETIAMVNRVLEFQEKSQQSATPPNGNNPNGAPRPEGFETTTRDIANGSKEKELGEPPTNSAGAPSLPNGDTTNETQIHTEVGPDEHSRLSPEASFTETRQKEPKESPTQPEKEVPEGRYILNTLGMKVSEESLKQQEEEYKEKIKSAKRILGLRRKSLGAHADKADNDKKAKEKVVALEEEIAKLEDEIKENEDCLKVVKERLLSLPPEKKPDQEQPWFEKVYADSNGYLVKDSEGNYKLLNETNTGRVLRQMGKTIGQIQRPHRHSIGPLTFCMTNTM